MADMTPALAVLPMYDWPEVHRQTDIFWKRIREAILETGSIPAGHIPAELDRSAPVHDSWCDPGLVIGQTCGLPYVTLLRGKVCLLGTPSYSISNEEGRYHSVIIANRQDVPVAGFEGMRFAYNDAGSQSGVAAWLAMLMGEGRKLPEGFRAVRSGAHRHSIRMVAEGEADMAAIDAVTFGLAERHEPAIRKVHVVGRTRSTPGLPLITSQHNRSALPALQLAIAHAIDNLDADVREQLLLTGFVPRSDCEYDGIQDAWRKLQSQGWGASFTD